MPADMIAANTALGGDKEDVGNAAAASDVQGSDGMVEGFFDMQTSTASQGINDRRPTWNLKPQIDEP